MGWPREFKKLVRIEVQDGCGEGFDEEVAAVISDVDSVSPQVVFANKGVGKAHFPHFREAVTAVVVRKDVVGQERG